MNAAASLAGAAWLTSPSLARLLAALDCDGEEARVIGGVVRDALMEEPHRGDIDIATTALPRETARRAQAAGFKAVPTGIDHGTITVVAEGRPIEVTTLREDVETFGRRASVRFGRDWKADAERRDFTINALSVTRDGTVIDLVGGLADIAARRVRFIGDARARVREDYLRILRFFRFHARFGSGAPDAEGLAAAIAERDGLALLSRERIRAELMKLMPAPRAAETLAVMSDSGIAAAILGVVLPPQFARLTEIERALELSPDAVRRMGVLALHATDDAERLRERLRLSTEETGRLASMAERWWRISPAHGEKAARALLYRLGPAPFLDRVLFAWSRDGSAADNRDWTELATLPERWQAPRFPLRAADFIARGVARGPALGAALKSAEEAWIAGDFFNEPAQLDALLAERAQAHQA